jgi:hypothetical protein
VSVRVAVFLCVAAAVAAAVAVAVAVCVAVAVTMRVAVSVRVAVAVFLRVALFLRVAVAVFLRMAVVVGLCVAGVRYRAAQQGGTGEGHQGAAGYAQPWVDGGGGYQRAGRDWRVTRSVKASVRPSPPRAVMPVGAAPCSYWSAGPPGRTRRLACRWSIGAESMSSG